MSDSELSYQYVFTDTERKALRLLCEVDAKRSDESGNFPFAELLREILAKLADDDDDPGSKRQYRIDLVESEGWYAGSVRDAPGVLSQGKTKYSALRNLAGAWKAMDETAEDDEAAAWAQDYERRTAAGELTEDERETIPFEQALAELDAEQKRLPPDVVRD